MAVYSIKLQGCDDNTRITMNLSDDEYKLIKRLAERSEELSEYKCMPVLKIKTQEDADEDNHWHW